MDAGTSPLETHRDIVRPEWIDGNGHMNMGWYLLVFDLATDAFLARIGLDPAHREAHGVTTFCAEAHVTYHREVRAGDPLRFTTLVLGHDARRIHYLHGKWHAELGWLAATNELLSLHVDAATRRGAPMAPAVFDRLARLGAAHASVPRPVEAGRAVSLANRAPRAPASAP